MRAMRASDALRQIVREEIRDLLNIPSPAPGDDQQRSWYTDPEQIAAYVKAVRGNPSPAPGEAPCPPTAAPTGEGGSGAPLPPGGAPETHPFNDPATPEAPNALTRTRGSSCTPWHDDPNELAALWRYMEARAWNGDSAPDPAWFMTEPLLWSDEREQMVREQGRVTDQ